MYPSITLTLTLTSVNGLQDTREYDLQGRLLSQGLADTQANPIDQRSYRYDENSNIQAIDINGTTTLYHYDLMGMLITETDAQGELIKDYLWQGMMPIAQINNSQDTEQILYLYSDHLMTNRLATNATQHIVWRWEGEAFGNTPAQELIGISVNLRFPGQYFDQTTNLHYNMMRYYDPELGRYITSDPIGLTAGLNTYSYVNANPIIQYDPTGEILPALGWAYARCFALCIAISAAIGDECENHGVDCAIECLNPLNWGSKGAWKKAGFKKHTKHRGSKKRTNDKHTKPRPGRDSEKKKNKRGWKPRK